jgi:hypothetical protein
MYISNQLNVSAFMFKHSQKTKNSTFLHSTDGERFILDHKLV